MKSLFLSLLIALVARNAVATEIEFVQELRPLKKGDGVLRAWVPVPLDLQSYQWIKARELSGNASSVQWGELPGGSGKYLFLQWVESVKDPNAKVIYRIEIKDRDVPQNSAENVQSYLQPTNHVQTDGVVAETSRKIVGSLKSSDDKALAIYNWVVENTFRNPKTRGCGLGDVKTTLLSDNLGGKCADINSVFVGLSRAAGVPAREVFGQRVAPSRFFPSLGRTGEISKTQHCRAEYYSLEKKSWIPVDPADVRKAILEEKLEIKDPKIQDLKAKFFGHWEGNWVAYNWARDFEFPEDKQKINFLMYPRIVGREGVVDGVDPDEFKYSLFAK